MTVATKASRLHQLSMTSLAKYLLPQLTIIRDSWDADSDSQTKRILTLESPSFAVRSSSRFEDNENESNAGKFDSYLDVQSDDLALAISKVFNSYDHRNPKDEILIQPYIKNSEFSGVIFTRDPSTGSSYLVINYFLGDDTSAVTSGNHSGFVTTCVETRLDLLPEPLCKFQNQITEICKFFTSPVDIEFICTSENFFIVQWRPLSANNPKITDSKFLFVLEEMKRSVDRNQSQHPYLVGDTTYFGLMPDWNPAELIGTRPSPLALSLFRELITDGIWAYERGNLGYRNVRSFPLLYDLSGHPYIDIRASINSLIPASLSEKLSNKVANLYLNYLSENRYLHDKVEFEVYLTCWTFDFKKKIDKYSSKLTKDEIHEFESSLLELTRTMIKSTERGLDYNLKKVETLKQRFSQILSSELDPLAKIYWLIEDCKRYGTLPFAGIARMAFVATSLLDSLVEVGALPQESLSNLISHIDSPAKSLLHDSGELGKDEFINMYGHLRPGTFDIRVPNYSAAYNDYFKPIPKAATSSYSQKKRVALDKSEYQIGESFTEILAIEGHELVSWCLRAIEARESCKFFFSRNISAALDAIQELGKSLDFSVEDLSYTNISTFLESYRGSGNLQEKLEYEIGRNSSLHKTACAVSLPPLIIDSNDIYCFTLEPSAPNFIGQLSVTSETCFIDSEGNFFQNSIVVTERADPGYDWIFSQDIKGLITCYGGANSHMAVRCKELGIPAAIGVGELIFSSLKAARIVFLDCQNKIIRVVS